MAVATTIQVSEALAERLRKRKQQLGLGSYEEVIERLLRLDDVKNRSRRGSWPSSIRWDPDRDRMRFRTDED